MVSGFTPLLGERVLLRQARQGDGPAIAGYRSLPEIARYQSWTRCDIADASRMMDEQAALAPDTPGSWFQLVIVDRASGMIVGDLALHFRKDDHRQVEIGINLAPPWQGAGLAAEAIGCALRYLFETLGKHRVSAITDAKNEASARLFRRLGFRQEGHLIEHVWYKGSYGSEYLFALLAREWRRQAGARRAGCGAGLRGAGC